MNWLLDTNACIAVLNEHPAEVGRRVSQALAQGDSVRVSAVAIFELQYGIARSARAAANEAKLSIFLGAVAQLPFDSEDGRTAGIIRAALRKSGTPIGPYDVLIAGQALRRELVLVTANTGEFVRVPGLRVENWAS